LAFPTWSTGNGGAAALTSGELRVDRGCLYVQQTVGGRHLVIWPDTWHVVLDAGTPVVMDGDTEVARVGAQVMLGGGEVTRELIPATASACDMTHVWGANSVVEPDQAPAP